MTKLTNLRPGPTRRQIEIAEQIARESPHDVHVPSLAALLAERNIHTLREARMTKPADGIERTWSVKMRHGRDGRVFLNGFSRINARTATEAIAKAEATLMQRRERPDASMVLFWVEAEVTDQGDIV